MYVFPFGSSDDIMNIASKNFGVPVLLFRLGVSGCTSTVPVVLLHFPNFGYREWSTLPVEPPLALRALYRKSLCNLFWTFSVFSGRFPNKARLSQWLVFFSGHFDPSTNTAYTWSKCSYGKDPLAQSALYIRIVDLISKESCVSQKKRCGKYCAIFEFMR